MDAIAGQLWKSTLVALSAAALTLMLSAEGLPRQGDGATSRSGGQAMEPVQDSDDGRPPRPGRDITQPELKKEVKPQYSERARQEKIEGEVLMDCVVKADGTVGDITIARSLHPDLDQAAIDAAKQWEFEPATRNGKPVAVMVTIAMSFTLE